MRIATGAVSAPGTGPVSNPTSPIASAQTPGTSLWSKVNRIAPEVSSQIVQSIHNNYANGVMSLPEPSAGIVGQAFAVTPHISIPSAGAYTPDPNYGGYSFDPSMYDDSGDYGDDSDDEEELEATDSDSDMDDGGDDGLDTDDSFDYGEELQGFNERTEILGRGSVEIIGAGIRVPAFRGHAAVQAVKAKFATVQRKAAAVAARLHSTIRGWDEILGDDAANVIEDILDPAHLIMSIKSETVGDATTSLQAINNLMNNLQNQVAALNAQDLALQAQINEMNANMAQIPANAPPALSQAIGAVANQVAQTDANVQSQAAGVSAQIDATNQSLDQYNQNLANQQTQQQTYQQEVQQAQQLSAPAPTILPTIAPPPMPYGASPYGYGGGYDPSMMYGGGYEVPDDTSMDDEEEMEMDEYGDSADF